MTTPVEQGIETAPSVAGDDDGTPAHLARLEVARGGNLALVRQVDPGAPEDLHHLLFEDGGIGVHRSVDAVLPDQFVPPAPTGGGLGDRHTFADQPRPEGDGTIKGWLVPRSLHRHPTWARRSAPSLRPVCAVFACPFSRLPSQVSCTSQEEGARDEPERRGRSGFPPARALRGGLERSPDRNRQPQATRP